MRERAVAAFDGTAAPLPQIRSLTSLRGLLALWVVLFHFWNDILGLFPSVNPLSPIAQRGDFAVPGFFLLSGFVLARKYAAWFERLEFARIRDFLALRLARIYPVHGATLLCVVAMVAVAHRLGFVLSNSGYSARQFVLNVLLLHAWTPHLILSWNYPSWSISSEWFAYLLFPLLIKVFRTALRIGVGAGTSFVVASLLSIFVLIYWRPLPFRELAVVVPTFFAGIAASRIACVVHANRTRISPRLAVTSAMAVVVACYLPGVYGLVALLTALFVLVLVVALVGDNFRTWMFPALLLLGEVSYSLYMTHTLAQKLLYRLLPVAGFSDRSMLARLGIIIIYGLSVALLCWGSYALVERPCRRWGRRQVEGPHQSIRSLLPGSESAG